MAGGCRSVHGVAGLAVVDASMIPEPPSGFPHIITIMIAEHLSEKLAAAFLSES
jgi:choline dehydrogenase-like flavoprotein